jgi:nucleotide-binding universal stress UspA family protein
VKIRKYTQQFPSADVFIGKQSLPYMKKIIVATDYSAEAENAADFAGAVAAEHCINQFEAVALVMGMANKSVEQDLLGNTTTSAIHKLQFPILAIPITTKYHGFHKVLFACDMEKGVADKVLENVHEIATAFGATVEVLYVKDKIEELLGAEEAEHAAIDKNFAGINYYYKSVQSRKIVDAIQDEIKETHADLLIMAPYKYGFWDSMVHRSKTRMMASGNNVPLLSLPS